MPTKEEELLEIARLRAITRTGAARSLRLNAKLSLPEVGRTVGAGAPTIYRWETGQRTPRKSPAALAYGRLLVALMRGVVPLALAAALVATALLSTDEPLAYTTAGLMARLPIGRHTARRLMRELGVQVSPRRRVLPRVRLEAWLAGEEGRRG